MDLDSTLFYDQKYIWHPFTQHLNKKDPIYIKSGKGSYLYDDKKNKIFDAISSWWVNLHGHCHPEIISSITTQLQKIEHVIFAEVVHEPAAQLAKNIASVLPEKLNKIFFSDNGSTTVEVALKLALQYWNNQGITKKRIIALQGSYHGDTFGAMSVAERNAFNKPFWPWLFHVDFVDPPLQKKDNNSLEQLEKLLEDPHDVAAFIYEPIVQGAGGMMMHDHAQLTKMLSLLKEKNILLIADEVMTGFGRTGKWFASDHLPVKPDIICLSKGITGGFLPLGLTVAKESIFEMFLSKDHTRTFFHGHSYTANPLACAAANASFKLMKKENTWNQIKEISSCHKKFAAYIADSKYKDFFSDIRYQGTILALEIRTNKKSGYFNNSMKDQIKSFFYSRGVFARPLGNILYLLPPYCSTFEDLQLFYDSVCAFFSRKNGNNNI